MTSHEKIATVGRKITVGQLIEKQIIMTISKAMIMHWCASVLNKRFFYPFSRRVASICYLCAGVVYIVLLGSPTSSITLVSSLREIPTVVVLHHPFLFGEIPT